jgi:dUTP pyrophosphatase
MSLEVIFTRLGTGRHDLGPEAPTRAHETDAGWDLMTIEPAVVRPGERVLVRTGIAIAMPPGWWGRIVGRSSTWHNWQLQVTEGVIDAGYRGELFIGLYNPGMGPCRVPEGHRLAQLIFLPVPAVHWQERPELPDSERGDNGFGSSGS